jgi:hypothetical protein
MSEHEDELKRALAENGPLDAGKATRDADEANAYFDAQLKRDARLNFWCRMIFAAALLEFAAIGFILTFSVKAMIGFAVLLLVAVVLICVFSIQYLVVNTKLNLLREIKLLRLERLGLPSDATTVQARRAGLSSMRTWRVLSLRESLAWLAGLLVVSGVVAYSTAQLMAWGLLMTEESVVSVLPDGSTKTESNVAYRYQGFLPLATLSLWTGDGPYAITRWLDGQGRDLPIRVATIGGNRRYTVQLAEPVMPGDQISYTTTTECGKMATKQGDTWTYHGGHKWAGKGQRYTLQTVQLPAEAEIVSVEPTPAQQLLLHGQSAVRFQAVVDEEHELAYAIKYRLPDEKKPGK